MIVVFQASSSQGEAEVFVEFTPEQTNSKIISTQCVKRKGNELLRTLLSKRTTDMVQRVFLESLLVDLHINEGYQFKHARMRWFSVVRKKQ
jgi:hypothetical protein